MNTITTATGKRFTCTSLSVIENPTRAYVRITQDSIGYIATVFSDPAETIQLTYGQLSISGFTKLIAVVQEIETVRIVLTKEV